MNESQNLSSEYDIGSIYTCGYKALEKEIKLIRSRQTPDMYIHEIVPLKKRLTTLEQFTLVQTAREHFENSPLRNNEFKAFIGSNELAVITPKYPAAFIYVCFFLLGGLVALMILLIKKGLMPAQEA